MRDDRIAEDGACKFSNTLSAFIASGVSALLPEGMMIRDTGVMIYPPFRITDTTISLSFEESARQLRFYLMYFDRHALVPFDVQAGMSMYSATTSEELALAESGLVQVVDRIAPFDSGMEVFARDAELLFEAGAKSGDKWALATPPGMVAGTEHGDFNAVTLVLRNLLPTPNTSIPIGEIIDFRTANADALRRLHLSIDKSLAQYGAGNADLGFDDIAMYVEAIKSELTKSKFPFFRVNYSISNLISNTLFTLAGAAAAAALGTDPVLGAGVGQSISIKKRASSLSRASNLYPSDFQYVVDVFSENLIDSPSQITPPLGGIKPMVFTNNVLRVGLSRQPDDHSWTGGGYFDGNVLT